MAFNGDDLPVRAAYLGDRLTLQPDLEDRLVRRAPALIWVDGPGVVVLFRYGVAVFFGVPREREDACIQELVARVRKPWDAPEYEDAVIRASLRDHVSDGVFFLKDFAADRLSLVATVLAKSVVLAHYEGTVKATFDQIEPLARSLTKHRVRRPQKDLLGLIGETLLVQTRTIGRSEVTEKPEVLWEQPELEPLYARLHDEFELNERQVALEHKLEVISRAAQTALDVLQHTRSLRVEWYIVWLIVIEIVLTLFWK